MFTLTQFFILVALALLYFLGLKQFHLWSQINDFFYGTFFQYEPIENFVPSEKTTLFLHSLRAGLLFPVVFLAKTTGLSIDLIFSSVCTALIFIIPRYIFPDSKDFLERALVLCF